MYKMTEEKRGQPEAMDGIDDLLDGAWCGHPPPAGGDAVSPPAVPSGQPPVATAPATTISPAPTTFTQVNNCTPPIATGSTRASIATTSGTTGSLDQDPGTFGRGYIQCKAARIGSRSTVACEATGGGNFGKQVNIVVEPVGNLDHIGDGTV